MNETDTGRQNNKLENLLVLSATELSQEQKKKRVDLLATVLLSLAAVLSALSAYQASRWYSEMNVHLAESSTLRAAAAKDDRYVNRQLLADMMLFIEWAGAFRKHDSTLVLALEDRFSDPLKKAFPVWMNLHEKGAAGLLPKGTPFDLPEYSIGFQQESDRLVGESERKFNLAKDAAQVGDDFIFSLVIFSLSLFFGAICTKIDTHILQASLLWVGVVILLSGIIIVTQLPWNLGL